METITVNKDDLEALVDYNYEDEYEHWLNDGEPHEGHIFLVINRLQKAIEEADKQTNQTKP